MFDTSEESRATVPTSRSRSRESQLETIVPAGISIHTIAFGDTSVPGLEPLFDPYRRLRAEVYVHELGIMDENELDQQGLDIDSDDSRSIHIAAVERTGDGMKVVGSIRLIVAGRSEAGLAAVARGLEPSEFPLPMERLFSEFGDAIDLRDGTLRGEISRYIARHDDRKTQLQIGQALHRVIVHHAVELGIHTCGAIVEDWLEQALLSTGVPMRRVTQARLIEKYHSTNFGVEIDMAALSVAYGETSEAILLPLAPEVPDDRVTADSARYSRNYGFWSRAEQEALLRSRVALAGVGGDGYMLGLTLVRMGVRSLRIADPEDFDEENINRVPGATVERIGKRKVDAFAEDARAIDPGIEIMVFEGGVTEDNVEEFVDGVDLVVDESELTKLEIGTMISDAARPRGIPVLIVMNVGFAAQVTTLVPNGPSFRDMMGLDSASLSEIAQQDVDLSRCVPYIAPYTDLSVLEAVQAGAPLPSVAQGVSAAVALGSSQAFLHLTAGVDQNRVRSVDYPRVLYVDSLTGTSRVVRNVQRSFKRSVFRMWMRSRRGRTTPLQYP